MNAPQNLTAEQFATMLDSIAKGVAPENAPSESVQQKLMSFRPTLLAYRKQGYSVRQLVAFLRDDRLGFQVSMPTVRKVLSTRPKKKAAANGAASGKVTAAATA